MLKKSPPPAAQLTLTVTNFRNALSLAERTFADASASLIPHSAVILVDRAGLPTLIANRAVDVEIEIASANPAESYKAIGVIFEQFADDNGLKTDADGLINFTQQSTERGTVMIGNKFVQTGVHGRYEFFVVIQRVSDGALGIIDPGYDNGH